MFQTRSQTACGGRALVPATLFLFLAACGSSTGGGIPAMLFEDTTSPNETPATASALRVGAPLHGDLSTPGDVDVYALDLAANRVVKIELFATRHDQSGWDQGPNVPRLTLLDTAANEHHKLLEHDYSGNFSDGWSWGMHDLDIPMFHVPATGTYFVQVTQNDQTLPGSSYILRASYVVVPNLQYEQEPFAETGVNDTPETAQLIRPGNVHGHHVAGEYDFYKFTVSAPTIVRFEMTAYRNGVWGGTDYYYDTEIGLYDTNGTSELAWDDDTYFYDSAIDYRIDEAGTYYLLVDEFDPADAEYMLSYTATPVGSAAEVEPNDTPAAASRIAYGQRRNGEVDASEEDWFSFTGTAGDMVRLQYFDEYNAQNCDWWVDVTLYAGDGETKLSEDGDDDLQTFNTILQESGTFYVAVHGSDGPAHYTIELTRFKTAIYETEPNGEAADANALADRVAGVIDSSSDRDVFKITLQKDRLVRFVCYASNWPMDSDGDWEHSGNGSDLAPVIELLDADGVEVAQSTSEPFGGVYTESVTQPLPTCALSFTAETAGTYYVRISDVNEDYGSTYYYVLEHEHR